MSLIRTAVWMLCGRWAFYFVTLISFSLIVRFITPSAYGVYVIAGTFLIFADVFFADAVENAIVRQPGELKAVASAAFWVVLGFSIVIASVVAGFAYPLGWIYGLDNLPPLMLGIAIVIVIQGLASVPRAILLKEGFAKKYSLYSGVCNFIGAIVGVSAAYDGYGEWSLVAQQGVLQLSMLLLCAVSVRFFPILAFSRDLAREMYGFVRTSFWSCVLNVLANRLDIIFLGLYFDSGNVGVYGLAKRLIQILQELVGSSFDKALVSFKAKKASGGTSGAYRQSVVAQGLLLFPSFIGFAIVGPSLVGLLFGSQWTLAAQLVAFMAIGGVFRSMVTIERAELVVQGLAGTILKVRFVELLIGLFFVVPFAHLGAAWMAVGFSLRYVIGYLLVLKSRCLSVQEFLARLRTTLGWLSPIFFATIAMGFVGGVAAFFISNDGRFSQLAGLCITIPVCVVVYFLVLLISKRKLMLLLKGD